LSIVEYVLSYKYSIVIIVYNVLSHEIVRFIVIVVNDVLLLEIVRFILIVVSGISIEYCVCIVEGRVLYSE